MKNFSFVLAILAGTCLVESNVYAIGALVCPEANQITYSCQKGNPFNQCVYHTVSGTPNDFGPYLFLPMSCTSDFDCSVVASNPPSSSSNGESSAECSYVIQGLKAYAPILSSSHFPNYYYTPSDASECKGATPSNKSGYCITYGNSYRK